MPPTYEQTTYVKLIDARRIYDKKLEEIAVAHKIVLTTYKRCRREIIAKMQRATETFERNEDQFYDSYIEEWLKNNANKTTTYQIDNDLTYKTIMTKLNVKLYKIKETYKTIVKKMDDMRFKAFAEYENYRATITRRKKPYRL